MVVASLFVFLFHLIYFYSIDTADDTAVSSTKSTTTSTSTGTNVDNKKGTTRSKVSTKSTTTSTSTGTNVDNNKATTRSKGKKRKKSGRCCYDECNKPDESGLLIECRHCGCLCRQACFDLIAECSFSCAKQRSEVTIVEDDKEAAKTRQLLLYDCFIRIRYLLLIFLFFLFHWMLLITFLSPLLSSWLFKNRTSNTSLWVLQGITSLVVL